MKLLQVIVPSAFLYGADLASVEDDVLSGWKLEALSGDRDGYRYVRTHYGYEGWIRKEAVRETGSGTDGSIRTAHALDAAQQKDTAAQSQKVLIRSWTDVLSLPKVQGEILETLPRGAFLCCLPETEKNYHKVRTASGKEGWIPEIAFAERMDTDGFFTAEDRPGYFLRQTERFLTEPEERTSVPGRRLTETEFRASAVRFARSYLGTQYRWGGHQPSGIDCSGLVSISYMLSGILIYRDAEIKERYPVRRIRKEQLKPGDLLYFPGHIAMYLGEKRYIHSTGYHDSFGCVINSLDPAAPDYRADLPDRITAYGSIF